MSSAIKTSIGLDNAWLQQDARQVYWVWEGVLALGGITLLSAPAKTGKSTLLSLLLDRCRAGGSLLGRRVSEAGALVCTEESHAIWKQRQPPLDFGPNVIFSTAEQQAPTEARWIRFANQIVEKRLEEEPNTFDLVVIDTAIRFLPLMDRNRKALSRALFQLDELKTLPVAVLIINQSRTVHRPLAALADIVIEMSAPRTASMTRRRIFRGVGRYAGTLQSVTAELNEAGTDYVPAEEIVEQASPLLDTLQKLLQASQTPLTRRELLERWPGVMPRADSLWRALDRGVEAGFFACSGKGTKSEPLRYALKRALETEIQLDQQRPSHAIGP